MSDIEGLRAQYPAIFELVETLQAKIAEAGEALEDDLQRLRSHEASRDQLNDRYARYRAEVEPMQRQIEHMAKSVGDVMVYQPRLFTVADGAGLTFETAGSPDPLKWA